jgi:hypothetical protein
MTQTLTQKSMLARLLANENIEVVQGNYPTAFFDVEKRVLGLPFFNNDISKDLYDLLVGHEVGHALFTPADGWHDSEKEVPNAPRALINIIEDIRIEKKILRQYPGLVACFKRGYKDLLDRNFFGIDGEDVSEMNLLDRLNLFSKSRGLVDVEFADDEKALVEQAMSVETWDDVLKSCSNIADFLGMEKPSEEEMDEQQIEASISIQSDGSDENEGDDESGQTMSMPAPDTDEEPNEEESDSSSEGEEEGDSEEQGDSGSEGDESEDEGKSEGSGDESTEEEATQESTDTSVGGKEGGRSAQQKTKMKDITSKTDEAFRENEKSLVNNITAGGDNVYLKGMSRDMFNHVKIKTEKLESHRKEMNSYEHVKFNQGKYDAWMKDAKAQVNLLVKEFEMRKAAYRTMRARTSNKGSLDVTKLHKYKYDDQLFKQVTQLADAKSHGMMMLVDFSGSMYRQIESVMRQSLIMGMFCKRVGIPFEVFGFTNSTGKQHSEGRMLDLKENLHTKVLTGDVQMTEILSSRMTKAMFERQQKWMYNVWRHMYYGQNGYDNMRGTPLYEALMGVHYALEDFLAKHPVQKMNLIVLTDGWGDSVQTQNGVDMAHVDEGARPWFNPLRGNRQFLDFRGKTLEVELNRRTSPNDKLGLQQVLLNNIKEEFGATVCHYFVAESPREYKAQIAHAAKCDWDVAQTLVNASRKKGAFIVDGDQGYDRRFILEARGDVLKRRDGDTDTLDINADMTAAQIATAFKKSSNGRSKQRFFSQKFAEMIA